MDFDEWLAYGITNDFCSPQFCATHDGEPITESEVEAWENGDDPCSHHVRLGSPKDWIIND